jgi:hypothetical protein
MLPGRHVGASLAESEAESAPLSEPLSVAVPLAPSACVSVPLLASTPSVPSAVPPSAGPGLLFEVEHARKPAAVMTSENHTCLFVVAIVETLRMLRPPDAGKRSPSATRVDGRGLVAAKPCR